MSTPTVTTIKRLFAVSGNLCAFPRCKNPLVHDGVVTGEVCHIRGRRSGAPRFDESQNDDDMHEFENLILLCPLHHSIIDADETAYTVERLVSMKRDHANKGQPGPEVSDGVVHQLLATINNVRSNNQAGGITAGVVNIHAPHGSARPEAPFSRVRLEALLNGDRQRQVEITNGLWDAPLPSAPLTRWEAQGPIQVGLIDDETFEVRVPRGDIWTSSIPYKLVHAAWRSADQRISLRLDGRLVLRPSGLSLEPER